MATYNASETPRETLEALAVRYMPLIEAVEAVLFDNGDIDDAMDALHEEYQAAINVLRSGAVN